MDDRETCCKTANELGSDREAQYKEEGTSEWHSAEWKGVCTLELLVGWWWGVYIVLHGGGGSILPTDRVITFSRPRR